MLLTLEVSSKIGSESGKSNNKIKLKKQNLKQTKQKERTDASQRLKKSLDSVLFHTSFIMR